MDNQIFTNQVQNFQSQVKKGSPFMKIIIIIFLAVIALEIALSLKSFLTPVSTSPVKTNSLQLKSGSIILSTEKSNYKVGEKVSLLIKISTGGRLINGTDIVLKYDPKNLEASAASFINGSVFDTYPPVNVDPKIGVIRVSGVSSSTPGFNGSGDFGTINFTAKAIGTSEIQLDYSPKSTADSNMLQAGTGEDVLEAGGSASINIQ